ncbi:MAG: hypothetical protein WBA45_14815 [Microthrixaceae bacterium]
MSLGVAWGLEYMSGESWQEPWSTRLPDSNVSGSWADVLWNGMLVDRELVLNVDGGRGKLPAGRKLGAPSATGSLMDTEVFAEEVSEWQAALARLVHCFESPAERFDEYMTRAGIVVVPAT